MTSAELIARAGQVGVIPIQWLMPLSRFYQTSPTQTRLILSYGDTQRMSDIPYCERRIGNPIIGMTARTKRDGLELGTKKYIISILEKSLLRLYLFVISVTACLSDGASESANISFLNLSQGE